MKALITGISGQIGSYLAELLLDKGYEVWGLIRRSSNFNTQRIDHIYSNRDLHLRYGDLSDTASLAALIKESDPDEVYHLAAMSHVAVSFQMPEYTSDVIAAGTIRMLEAMRLTDCNARFYHSSSSEMFGNAPAMQNELTQFDPQSPYAIAKVFAHCITCNYREAYGMYAVNGICFNNESIRRGKTFVTRKITIGVAEIKFGLRDSIQLGNLDALRDWGYTPDYCRGIWASLQQPEPSDYVLATGRSTSVREFCNMSFRQIGLDLTWQGKGVDEIGMDQYGKVRVQVDPKYFRPAEVAHLCGDATKAHQILKWKPTVYVEKLSEHMVAADIESIGQLSHRN